MKVYILRGGIVGFMLLMLFIYLPKTDSSRGIANYGGKTGQIAMGGDRLLEKDKMTAEDFADSTFPQYYPLDIHPKGGPSFRKKGAEWFLPKPYPSSPQEYEEAICPIRFASKRISSAFAVLRRHPLYGSSRPHYGIDCAAHRGSPVSAAGDGQVVFAGRRGGYGNLVILAHDSGWTTWYGHLSKIEPHVKMGVTVHRGVTIGRVGSTGLATGPHLHFETRMAGQPVNPSTAALTRAAGGME